VFQYVDTQVPLINPNNRTSSKRLEAEAGTTSGRQSKSPAFFHVDAFAGMNIGGTKLAPKETV
jgi:hypothetical protein